MSKIDDGGAAFPLHLHGDYAQGMTLRDYFAAAALQGHVGTPCGSTDPKILAAWSYQNADAMIAERKETQP